MNLNKFSSTNRLEIFKIIMFYFIGFIIMYIEPIPIAGINIAVIWKVIFITIIAFPVIIYINKKRYLPAFIIFAFLLSFKMLFNLSLIDHPISNVTWTVKNLMFPLLYLFFLMKFNKEQLLFTAKHFSILIILSFVPFMLGVLNSLSEGYTLASYGFSGSYGLVGVFQGPHSASESLGVALIVVFYFFEIERSRLLKIVYLGLLGFGILEIILTYARSGLVIAFIGIFFLWMKEKGKNKIATALLFLVPIIFLFVYQYETNPVFKMRLNDESIYNKQELGSGRPTMAKHAIMNWYNEGFTGNIIGLGFEYGLEKMEKSLGLFFAHNYYIQILQQEGLMGVFLFLMYLLTYYQFMRRHKSNDYYSISMALFLGYLVEMLLQGNFLMHMFILMAVFLVLMKKTEEGMVCQKY